MAYQLTRSQLQYLRLQSQALFSQLDLDPTNLVARLGAIQSQEKPSSLLAVRQRTNEITQQEVEDTLHTTRTIIRTWLFRGTLHLVAADDLHWMLDLIGERLIKQSQRRYKQLELDELTLSRSGELLAEILDEHDSLTRPEIGEQLETRGLSPEGQRIHYIMRHAALTRLVCFGPDREDGTHTFVLLNEWFPTETTTHSGDWQTLAHRYLSGYGPASIKDFATWSGAPMKDARRTFEALEKIEVEADGQPLWLLVEDEERLALPLQPSIQLIPAYDPILLGYQSRDWILPELHAHHVFPGGGFLRPTVLVDGEGAGIWKIERHRNPMRITINLFETLTLDENNRIQTEADDIGRYLNAKVSTDIQTL